MLKKNRLVNSILLFATIVIVTSCSNVFPNIKKGEESTDSSQYGSINIVTNDTSDTSSSRAVYSSSITNATITVTGSDIDSSTILSAENVSLTNGTGSGFTIDNIPVGKNRIITVQAQSDAEGTKIDGYVIRAVADIIAGDNTITVNWDSTALGNVFNSLYLDGYDISGITDSEKTTISTVISNTSESINSEKPSALIDTDAIATDFKNGALEDSSSYVLSGASLSLTYYQANNFTTQVGDPCSAIATECVAGSSITITDIAPGTWPVYILDSTGTVLEKKSITITSGDTMDLGILPCSNDGILILTEKADYPLIHYWDCDNTDYSSTTWPGTELSEIGDYYEYSFDDTTSVQCLITNSSGEKLCSTDISITEKGIYLITASGAEKIADSEDSSITDPVDPTGSATVYVKASSAPSIWIWQINGLSSSELMGETWPGSTMTDATDLNWNDGWYQLTIPETAYTAGEAFSFKLNGGSTQLDSGIGASFWYDGTTFYSSDPTVKPVPEDPTATITTDATTDGEGNLSLERTITITLDDGNDTITDANVTITGDASGSYTYTNFTDDVLTIFVGDLFSSTGKTFTVSVSVTNSIGTDSTSETYTTIPAPDETEPTISANQALVSAEESISDISFTITDNKDGTTKAYYTTESRNATTSDTLYVSGDASDPDGITGSSFTISESTRYHFLVVDAAGNSTIKTFYYNIGSVDRDDFREESIYFVMTTRFYDGDSSNNEHCSDDTTAGNGDDDPAWRGDFKGLAEKLDYIKALGFSAVWITPVVKNMSGYDYHGYHSVNMSEVDPRYESTDYTYDDLIEDVHAHGMKLIQDIVLNHTGNFGDENLHPLFEEDSDGHYIIDDYDYDTLVANDLLESGAQIMGGSYSSLTPGNQFQARIQTMRDLDIENHYHHHEFKGGWEQYEVEIGSIAGDCQDLDTENPDVAEYLRNCYIGFINRGVDAFRIDTVKHISRLTFNNEFIPQFKEAAEDAGNDDFFMFGEVCSRYRSIWNDGKPPISAPFYTWNYGANGYDSSYGWSDRETNETLTETFYNDNLSTSSQPTTDNCFLDGNDYHTPDYSKRSYLDVIDFPMHWAFNSVSDAYSTATGGDQYYNDATFNVVYVDSHDYAPDGAPENQRYAGSWPEKLSLMFTFRGIPCIYYGSEIEFQKGCSIDVGTTSPLAETGRAYYGDYLEGTVTATDFGQYSASGTVADTLSEPLAQHIRALNLVRRAIPALQMGEYKDFGNSGNQCGFARRYTNTEEGIDSFALITVNGSQSFSGIPNGTYRDVITGETHTVSDSSATLSCSGDGNLRVWVLIDGANQEDPGWVLDGLYPLDYIK